MVIIFQPSKSYFIMGNICGRRGHVASVVAMLVLTLSLLVLPQVLPPLPPPPLMLLFLPVVIMAILLHLAFLMSPKIPGSTVDPHYSFL